VSGGGPRADARPAAISLIASARLEIRRRLA
jgi:hypothetical protein